MDAMIARTLQILLLIIGLLFVLAAIFTLRTGSTTAASGFIQSIEAALTPMLYLFISFLCFFGAYRIGKGQNKKSGQPPSSDQKG